MSDDNTQGGAEPSLASAGSVDEWYRHGVATCFPVFMFDAGRLSARDAIAILVRDYVALAQESRRRP